MFMHRPMEVENVEIERMRLHMERDGKGEMNCWAALGTVRKSTSELDARENMTWTFRSLQTSDGSTSQRFLRRRNINFHTGSAWTLRPARRPTRKVKLSLELHGVKAAEG